MRRNLSDAMNWKCGFEDLKTFGIMFYVKLLYKMFKNWDTIRQVLYSKILQIFEIKKCFIC